MNKLEKALIKADAERAWEPVRIASIEELGSFEPVMAECHENARRWAAANAGFSVVKGWVPMGVGVFNRHSVVRGFDGKLVCVTLGPQRLQIAGLIRHEDDWSDLPYERLLPQLIILPPGWETHLPS